MAGSHMPGGWKKGKGGAPMGPPNSGGGITPNLLHRNKHTHQLNGKM